MPYLVLGDADKVHDYIFGTQELKRIRGASQLQRALMEENLPQAATEKRGDVIFAGGGRILVSFKDIDDATKFRREAEAEFQEKTGTASISTACTEYDLPGFQTGLRRVQSLLEEFKTGGRRLWTMRANSFFAVCESCGREPATTVEAEEDIEGEPSWKKVGVACIRRKEASQRSNLQPRWEKDFQAISRGGKPDNYLAAVYVDMDRLGRWLDNRATTPELYRKNSKKIDKAVWHAVQGTLREIGHRDGGTAYEILMIGGDDAIVVMQPQLIFDWVHGFYSRLDELTKRDRPDCSMGILIAHQQYPIRSMVDGAGELLRNAKRRRKGDAVDYALLNESMTAHITNGRDRGNDGLYRTAKPYPGLGNGDTGDPMSATTNASRYEAYGFRELKRKLARLKNEVSSSRLKELGRLVHKGEAEANLEYCYLLWRAPEGEKRVLLEEVGPEPWGSWGGDRRTDIADLVELWRLV